MFVTSQEAEAFGLTLMKNWIDDESQQRQPIMMKIAAVKLDKVGFADEVQKYLSSGFSCDSICRPCHRTPTKLTS